jgi:hypothetical protein
VVAIYPGDDLALEAESSPPANETIGKWPGE